MIKTEFNVPESVTYMFDLSLACDKNEFNLPSRCSSRDASERICIGLSFIKANQKIWENFKLSCGAKVLVSKGSVKMQIEQESIAAKRDSTEPLSSYTQPKGSVKMQIEQESIAAKRDSTEPMSSYAQLKQLELAYSKFCPIKVGQWFQKSESPSA